MQGAALVAVLHKTFRPIKRPHPDKGQGTTLEVDVFTADGSSILLKSALTQKSIQGASCLCPKASEKTK